MPVHSAQILVLRSRNRFRSLTAEKLYEGFPKYQVCSAGTQPDARVKVTEGLLGRADRIFVMEKSHLNRLRMKFSEALEGKPVIVLHIPDEYEFMDPDLLEELCMKLSPHLELP